MAGWLVGLAFSAEPVSGLDLCFEEASGDGRVSGGPWFGHLLGNGSQCLLGGTDVNTGRETLVASKVTVKRQVRLR